jgi:hypothetical protein
VANDELSPTWVFPKDDEGSNPPDFTSENVTPKAELGSNRNDKVIQFVFSRPLFGNSPEFRGDNVTPNPELCSNWDDEVIEFAFSRLALFGNSPDFRGDDVAANSSL